MDVEHMAQATAEEIEKVFSTKTVVGEPTTIGDTTLIPLISIGFAFGAGGGSGSAPAKQGTGGEGEGGGTGGGAGVRPVAVIIIDKNGTRIEPIVGGMAAAIEKMGENIPKILEEFLERRKKKEE